MIKIVFKNIHKSYDNVKDYIRNNNMTSSDVNKIIKLSTSIPNRIMIENF